MTAWVITIVPQRVFLDLGVVTIYWYGLLMMLAIGAGFFLARRLYLQDHQDDRFFVDVVFYAGIAGIIGARLWHVFVFQWGYYASHVDEIVKIWQGGLAIQGALVLGAISIYVISKIQKRNPLQITDYVVPGLALGQAIGRWGNFFNQELYGLPSQALWAIYIEPQNRVPGFEQFGTFHPTFLYESLLNLILCYVLLRFGKKKYGNGVNTALYLVGYGVIRFMIDFVRIDPMPALLGLRFSQILSLVFVLLGVIGLFGFTRVSKRGGIVKE